jgi:predicted RNA-binding Zn ribbon-like protein
MPATTVTSDGILLIGGRLCLDFCNTVIPNPQPPYDTLAKDGFPALLRWCCDTHILEASQAIYFDYLHQTQPELAESLFQQAQCLRHTLTQLFTAVAQQRPIPNDVLDTLQRWLLEAHEQQQIVLEDKKAQRIWRDSQHPALMLHHIVLSAENLLFSDDIRHIKQCPGCGWLFFDGSKNHRRMWCNMRACGNRAKNRRFHQRRKHFSRA